MAALECIPDAQVAEARMAAQDRKCAFRPNSPIFRFEYVAVFNRFLI